MTRTAIAAIVTGSVAVIGLVSWGVKRHLSKKKASAAETKQEANAA